MSAISVPETDIPAEDNLEAYFIRYSPDQQEAIVTEGLISDVKSTHEEVSFLFEPIPGQIDTPYPLFVRVNEAVQLIGIFSPIKNRFIHIHEFSSETRTPGNRYQRTI